MPKIEPKYHAACPLCGSRKLMVPIGVNREAVSWYSVPGEPTFVAFNVAPCAGCGVMRAYRHFPPNYRDEPAVGEEHDPPPPPPPPLAEDAKCPDCEGPVAYAAPGRVPMGGLWAVCDKCERALSVEDGKLTGRMSLGIAKPKDDEPPPAEGEKPPADDEKPPGNRRQRRQAQRRKRGGKG